jgi:peptidoglycan L-alanyl-D-glutamate endopeptidase CwlK
MDPFTEERLKLVHPVLADRVHKLISALEGEGFTPRVTRGLASVADQDAIWQKGRDANGNKIGVTYTNAKGAQSNHVLGYAVDFTFLVDGKADWTSKGFDRLVALAPSFGLRSGASWKDTPHVELSEVPAKPTDEMQQTYRDAGVDEVWKQFPIDWV